MIHRFKQVNDNLYRGSAPSVKDVIALHNKYGVNKIVSLDYDAGKKIDKTCKILGVEHIMMPVDVEKKSSLLTLLNTDLSDLLQSDPKVFLHCKFGRDRTGFVIAMFRCEHDGWSCQEAIKEAKSLGFGLGIDAQYKALYIKLIKKACGCSKKECDTHQDDNYAFDIAESARDISSGYSDYSSNIGEQNSWGPYEDYRVRSFPYATTDNNVPEQYETRLNYGLDDVMDDHKAPRRYPQVGVWDVNTSGISGSGPSFVGSGFV